MLLSFETYWKHPNLEPFFLLFYDNWTQHTLVHVHVHNKTHTDKQTDRPIVEASKREEIISKQNKKKRSNNTVLNCSNNNKYRGLIHGFQREF